MEDRVIDFKTYKPNNKRRRAYLVEPYQGPKPELVYTFKDDPRYQHVKHPDMNIYCIYCGVPAEFIAYFRTQGVTVTEKYCNVCLDKYIIK